MDSSSETVGEQQGVSFVLPCLNEAPGLSRVIESLHQASVAAGLLFEVVIVDNKSTDDSPAIIKTLCEHFPEVTTVYEPRRGYGLATRTGIAAAHNPLVVCLDADGTYTTNDAIACAQLLIQNPQSFVIGNRLSAPESKESMPWAHRTIGTPLIALLLRILFGVKITDPNCGLRGLSKQKFESLKCTSSGMEFASEEIARATYARMECIEFPISYKERIGESKLRTMRDGMRHAYAIFATRLKLFGTPR